MTSSPPPLPSYSLSITAVLTSQKTADWIPPGIFFSLFNTSGQGAIMLHEKRLLEASGQQEEVLTAEAGKESGL